MRQPRSSEAASIDRQVGLRLRALRESRGLTQAALGRLMGGVSGQAVAKYEAGEAAPAARLFWTSRAFGVPLDALFEGLAPAAEGEGPDGAAYRAVERPRTPARDAAALLREAPSEQHPVILAVVEALVKALPMPRASNDGDEDGDGDGDGDGAGDAPRVARVRGFL